MLTIILCCVAISFLLIYIFYQYLSERYIDWFSFFVFVAANYVTIHLSTDMEKYSNALILSIMLNGIYAYIHSLSKIKVSIKSLKDDCRNILSNPAYAFKINEKFSKTLQNQSYEVTKYYCQELETLEKRLLGEFPNSETVDPETAKLLLSISSKKSISALEQFSSGEIFLRTKFFTEFWKEAVKSSSSYLSICDLSMYSGKNASQIKSEKLNWQTRVESEIEVLKKEKIKVFDKIILFESSQEIQNDSNDTIQNDSNDTIQNDSNDTIQNDSNDTIQNDSNDTIFDVVVNLWESKMQELKDLGIKSHYQSENGNCLIWKFSREDVSSWLEEINQSDQISGQINSYDLGIFGDNLIVEEFKVNEASTIVGRIENSDVNKLKFLYRLSLQKDLIKQIKRTITEKMTYKGTMD